ncbi:uncharacterized protein NPIL_259211 [Nephila pilipes]|uniref:Uncharacterized protein n=1 Tax=Nephila pilipes TaxID=299642 RepID=A0A8X6MSI2_NEPPI|nr:uncharacterized protein NPIL_259211 [Nephila pilipes]
MKPYLLQIMQRLTNADKQALVSAAQILLRMVHMDLDILFIFSGEATCHKSGRVSKHNCVIWVTKHPKEVGKHVRDSPQDERLVCSEQSWSNRILPLRKTDYQRKEMPCLARHVHGSNRTTRHFAKKILSARRHPGPLV